MMEGETDQKKYSQKSTEKEICPICKRSVIFEINKWFTYKCGFKTTNIFENCPECGFIRKRVKK